MKRMGWLLLAVVAAGLLLVSCSQANSPVNGKEGTVQDTSLSVSENAQEAVQEKALPVKEAGSGGAREDKQVTVAFSASRNAAGDVRGSVPVSVA